MFKFPGIEPVDYLIVGHITQDVTPMGLQPGGTAAYAGLTAHALGQRVGVVTSWGEENSPEEFANLAIANQVTDKSSTFENVYSPEGRIQKIHHQAPTLDFYHVPQLWRNTPIVHIAPVAQEVNPNIVRHFPDSDIYITPQGWLRRWNQDGEIFPDDWPEARYILRQVQAVVLSEEDIQNDPLMIEAMAEAAQILVITRGDEGADLYLEGAIHHIPATPTEESDTTGAGDIFAAVFFSHLTNIGNPIEAAHFASQVAAISVTRQGIRSTPTEEDLYNLNIEVT